ncbi:MAG: DegQ family serine endoprotease [Wenzhouxiangella sp.]|jgi:serine protease Do|nr:DegQ family serine endoprotease [Wenzhouxiangella sp.]
MNRLPFLLPLLFGLLLQSAEAATPTDFTDLVGESIPAVVNIETTRFGTRPSERMEERRGRPENLPDLFEEFFGPQGPGRGRPDRQGGGSGFIFSEDGLILTNHHVIEDADEIIVRLADRREYEAELVGSDAATDIAVLRIDADGLPTLEFGDSGNLRPGEWVIAIGSPFQFEQSVTAGIVSAKGRTQSQQQYVPFIQSDVAINRGNSGGPLIRTDGTVVGINSWILSSSGGNIGLSFAIPIEVAESSVEQLLEYGRVVRGYLGVGIEVISRQKADALNLDRPAGALVNRVEPGSAAERAGIEVGDVIVSFNGRDIDVFSDLPPMVGMVRPGTEVEIEISRWGERRTLEVTLDQLEETLDTDSGEPPADVEPSNALGLAVEPIDSETRRQLGDPDGGVLVTNVESDNAYRAGVRRGQVILMINNRPVSGIDDFNDIVEDLSPGQTIALLLQRSDGSTTFVAYTPESDD